MFGDEGMTDLEKAVARGKFREDLLWRLNGKRIQLPALRTRVEDIPLLAEHFLEWERPRRNKILSEDAKQRLAAHAWPGNVRELKRVCEQIGLYSPLPIIRGEDVDRVLPGITASSDGSGVVDLDRGLNDLLAAYEASLIRMALKTGREIEDVAQLLKISRSSLYKKIKDYNIEITE